MTKSSLYLTFLILLMAHNYGNGQTMTYLALGDSYTIGESVSENESYPFQVVSILDQSGVKFSLAKIVAKTGWTTDELQTAIENSNLPAKYDVVSLLIGVNNQYRGRSLDEYAIQFENLCKIALSFAGNKPSRVFILSIPDWGLTPFAEGRDRKKISSEIDAFNEINKSISEKFQFTYIDITISYRQNILDASMTAPDGLHPSGKSYEIWAKLLAAKILTSVK